MINTESLEKPSWVTTILQLQGSVVLMILPRILFFCSIAAAICILSAFDLPIYLEKMGDLTTNVIYNLILGLLLVFRTNTSYDRFWEGRKAWGTIAVNIRNLASELQANLEDSNSVRDKHDVIHWLEAFAIATKNHLRGESNYSDLTTLVTSEQLQQLSTSANPPLDIIFWIRQYLQQQLKAGQMVESQVAAANEKLNQLVSGLSSCERIITTPIPIAYRIYLKRLIFIYCIGLPFKIAPDLTWWAIPIMAIVSFLLLGVEEVARELENPFGYNENDLPLDDICNTISQNIDRTIALGVQPLSVKTT